MAGAALGTAAAVLWLLVAERSGSSTRFVAKPLASAGFVAVALASGAADTPFGRWMLVALVLSALGDVFLLGQSEGSFLAGLGSFLAAHLAFAGAFAVRGLAAAGLVSVVGFALIATAVLAWLRPHVSVRMRGPVAAYVVAISIMGTLAVATAIESWEWRIVIGAGLFIVSDLAVARNTFVAPGFVNRLWGLPLYYAGQLVLAWAAGD